MNKILKLIIFLIILIPIGAGFFFIFTENKNYSKKIEINTEKEDLADEINKNNEADKVEEKNLEKKTETKKVSISRLDVKNNLVNFGFEKKDSRTIDTIIIHSSYDAMGNEPYDVSGLIKEYKQYGVAPHYLIDRLGAIYLLVEEKNVAYHAGVSEVPDGRSGVNAFSIGIELMNTKNDKYSDEQYASLKELLANIKSRYKIKYTLGHKDISPGRKDDPWNFDNSFLVY